MKKDKAMPSPACRQAGGKQGFSLIELIVAMAVFVFVVSAVSGLFAASLRAQRSSIAYQQLLDQTSYLMEYMSRAIRMAKKDISGACTGTPKINYVFADPCLKFVNYKNQCQQFCREGTRMKDENGLYLTAEDLNVAFFNVILAGQLQTDDLQPKVTISLDVSGKESARITIQTTISQRNLDVKR